MTVLERGQTPANGDTLVTLPRYGDKRAVANMLGMSRRTVDNLLASGCPHLRLGSRRVRFDLGEVAAWLKETYGVQRRAKVSTNGTAAA